MMSSSTAQLIPAVPGTVFLRFQFVPSTKANEV
jgi:hypothetical protein